MHPRSDFQYYHTLQTAVTNALLHLLMHVSLSNRYTPTIKRNEILVKHLKPLLKNKRYAAIKKDVRSWISIGRNNQLSLEQRLYLLHDRTQQTSVELKGAETLYQLLEHIYDTEQLECQLYKDGAPIVENTLYILEEHIDHCFDENNHQVAPLSLLIQSETAPRLIDTINTQGGFRAEMYEWNQLKQQAHIHLHPR